jgi:hypothetical protein
MRLINENRLYDCLMIAYQNEEIGSMDDVAEIIASQPTIYDINKVIEELEDLDIYYDNDYFSSKGNTLIDRKYAIEIVKNGLDKTE